MEKMEKNVTKQVNQEVKPESKKDEKKPGLIKRCVGAVVTTYHKVADTKGGRIVIKGLKGVEFGLAAFGGYKLIKENGKKPEEKVEVVTTEVPAVEEPKEEVADGIVVF